MLLDPPLVNEWKARRRDADEETTHRPTENDDDSDVEHTEISDSGDLNWGMCVRGNIYNRL